MKQLYCLIIDKKFPIDAAWTQLEHAGIEVAYSDEDDSLSKLFVYADSPDKFNEFGWITHVEAYVLPEIDWDAQWEAHGLDYKEGYVNLDLKEFGRDAATLKLEPGPGFGDLSHPTTRLVLRLLAQQLDKEPIIDIGCGSGVLTLAALALGASRAWGIDIDPDALQHSRKNAEINQMSSYCQFYLPEEVVIEGSAQKWVLLMNMIMSEQAAAWKSLSLLHHLKGTILTSGIRVEERENYLLQTDSWGWRRQHEIEEDGWLAFQFSL